MSLGGRRVELRLIKDRAHYDVLVQRVIASARVSLWISTANVKELRVEAPVGTRARARGKYVSLLDMLASLGQRGVELRLLHAGVPSRAFRGELLRHEALRAGKLAMRQCPRVHLKMIAVDGAALYLGSANLTGAGLGAKGEGRRNFEAGILTDDDVLLDEMQETFDRIWSGKECRGCRLRAECPAPLDGLRAGAPPAAAKPTRGTRLPARPRSRKGGA
ncbi:phospholipase D family protein [Polyangium aurulentum]|uniref:phospholipase D family protein n=1 Tax=Polyangium aurulentum TaxID=2567896 RepID=UPI0010AEAE32|nr:phospholipase D family protein [Polyangium aurulentum]UQA55198.1 phospholipase D family protein [Polyangium aurulentum]